MKKQLVLVLLFALSPVAPANQLVTILEHVDEYHPRILGSAYEVATAQAGIRSAKSAYLPYLEVDYAATKNESDYTVRGVLPIWRGGVTGAEVGVEKMRFEREQHGLALSRLELATEVADAYFLVAADLAQLTLDRKNVREHERLFEVINKRARAGASPKSDVETAVARLEVAKAQQAATAARLDSNHARLVSLSSLEIEKASVAWPAVESAVDGERLLNLREVANFHPRSLVAGQEIAISRAEIQLRRRRMLPELLLVHERDYLDGDNTDSQTALQIQFRGQRTNRALADRRVEELSLQAATSRFNNTLLEVQQRLRVLQADTLGAAAQMEAQRQAVKSTEYLVGSFRRQFEAGKKTWLEVLNAQREAYQNERLLNTQRRLYWASLVSLQIESGRQAFLPSLLTNEVTENNKGS